MSDLPPIRQRYEIDTTDFKAGIAAINREMRLVESGFRATAAALGDWGASADGLQARLSALTKEIALQESKIAGLQGEYKRVADEQGETSRAAQELQIKLNKETETLNKMKSELSGTEKALDGMGNEAGQAGDDVDRLGDNMAETTERSGRLRGAMDGLKMGLAAGALAIAGLAAAAAATGAAIAKLVGGAADAAGELVDLSLKTGLSTTALQELSYIGGQVGTDVDTIAGSLAKLTRSMDAARDGTGAQAEAFAAIGVAVTNADGSLRSSQDVFAEVIDTLGKMPNETERDAVALALLGRSAMELNPLIKAGSDEIARLTDQAHQVGAVMSEESVAGLESFGDELASLQAGLKGTLGELAAAFLPAFQGLAGTAKTYLGQFGEIVRGADGDLGKMAAGVGSLIGRMVGDIARQAPQLMQAGLGIIQGIINAIVANLPQMAGAAVQMVTTLVQFIVANLPLLIKSGVQLIVTLATGIAQALPELIPTIVEIIPVIILTLLEALPLLVDAALQLILALAQGLIAAIPILIPYIPMIVKAIFDALIASLPLIGQAAVELIMTLLTGIIGALPALGPAAVQTVETFVRGVSDLAGELLDVGRNIVTGVWQGIEAQAGWFGAQIQSFFGGIVDSVKGALGIRSPSAVFADIGKNMALGLGVGFDRSFAGIEAGITRAVNGMSFDVPALATATAGSGRGASPISLTIHVRGVAGSPGEIGKQIGDRVIGGLRAVGAI